MEVRPGYKLTEVGVIPEGWEVAPLGKYATFRTGPFGSALHQADYISNGIPVINPMHIDDGTIVPSETMTVSAQTANTLSDFKLKSGEIVIGRRGDMGRCAVVCEKQAGWLCGTGSMIIRPAGANADYLQRILSSRHVIAAIENASVGTTMVNLNQGTLSGLKIQFPPLSEQSAIATAFSDMDALLDGLDRLIAKKRAIKQAAMQQLLTAQTRLPGFSGEWAVKRLGEICELSMGRTPPRLNLAYWGDGYVWLSIADMKGKVATESKEEITPAAAFMLTVVPKGTLMMSFKLSIGRLGFAGCDLYTNEAICAFNKLKEDAEYIYYALHRVDFSLYGKQAVKGYTLNKESLRSVEVSLPSAEEQTAIAAGLSDMDAEITALETRRGKTRALKQAMMQELLTGRTRLL